MSASKQKTEDEFIEMLEEAELDLPPSPAPRPAPSKIRFCALLIVAVYPLITTLLYILTPLTAGWAVWQRTIIITPVMCILIIFAVSPSINHHFGWLIAGLPRPRPQKA